MRALHVDEQQPGSKEGPQDRRATSLIVLGAGKGAQRTGLHAAHVQPLLQAAAADDVGRRALVAPRHADGLLPLLPRRAVLQLRLLRALTSVEHLEAAMMERTRRDLRRRRTASGRAGSASPTVAATTPAHVPLPARTTGPYAGAGAGRGRAAVAAGGGRAQEGPGPTAARAAAADWPRRTQPQRTSADGAAARWRRRWSCDLVRISDPRADELKSTHEGERRRRRRSLSMAVANQRPMAARREREEEASGAAEDIFRKIAEMMAWC